jgi:benzoate/toluate 1,2-dioxygenase beta subunit
MAVTTQNKTRKTAAAVDIREIEQLLYREAHCLDDRARWDEWLDLYTDDALYWIPYTREQTDYENHASICLENKMQMEVRLGKLRHGRSWSQQPPSRTARVVGNIVIEGSDAASGELVVKSTFTMFEFRRDQYQPYAGFYTHRLRRVGESWKIAHKRVDLVSADGIYENFIQVPI